jgi:hypothetical protein
MLTSTLGHRRHGQRRIGLLFVSVLFLVAAQTGSATTYISAEPVPNVDIVGAADLAKIRGIGYSNLERWSQRLLGECRIVDNVIGVLADNGVITTVASTNTRFVVAAGGFEGSTNPSYVFTVKDSGPVSVSESDVNVLSNALGYVLNQGSTAHFSPDNPKAYGFALDYALVTFAGTLTGEEAQEFFEHLDTVDPALFSGLFAGFTQLDFGGSLTNNSMLFLQPAVSKRRFIDGLSTAASSDPRATYSPVKNQGQPTTARAGIAFPGNDWLAFPDGDGYLVNIGDAPRLRNDLKRLQEQHRVAVTALVQAIDQGNVAAYLESQFTCPS